MSTKPKKDLLMSSKRLLGLLESGSFGFPSDHWIIKDLKEAILEEEENRKTGKYSPVKLPLKILILRKFHFSLYIRSRDGQEEESQEEDRSCKGQITTRQKIHDRLFGGPSCDSGNLGRESPDDAG